MDKNELFATMPVPQALRRMILPAAVSQIIVLGAVPTVLSNVMSSLVRSIGHSREAGFGVTLGAVLNIVLDPVFMYWILPDGQQVLGVGLATLVSNCVSFLYFLGILWEIRSRNLLTADPRAGLPRRKTLVAVLGVGIPSATTSLLFDLDYMVVDKLMVAYSDAALAAIGIVLKVERLPLNTGIGIGRVAMVLAILRWAVFNIPMLVLLNALVGMYGILWTPAIGDGITVLLSLAAYLRWRPRARTETPQ